MAKSNKGSVNRRGFLKGAAAGAAAMVTSVEITEAQRGGGAGQGAGAGTGSVPPPSPDRVERDAGNVQPPAVTGRAITRPGSDLMTQVLKDLGVEYVAANPGSSFEGLQESLINYGNPPNRMPEFITALHEESAVTMAHGYGKAEGKPMCALLHGTIGVQHAAMSIYQAYYDRTPVLMITGRDEGFIQAHTAHDMAAMVRSFTKWDAQPKTLEQSLAALQRAYNEAITPPMGPTLVVLDTELQKEEARELKIPAYRPPQIAGIDLTKAREIAKGLLDAQNPRIEVRRLRTAQGARLSVELAELVGASAGTGATTGPMRFPQRHPLCGPGSSTAYDYTLGLEIPAAQASIIGPGLATLLERDSANIGFGGIAPAAGGRGARGGAGATSATAIQADAEASLPLLIEEVKRQLTPDKRRIVEERKAKHAEANQKARIEALTQAVQTKRNGWDSSTVATARIYAELLHWFKNADWCLASLSC